MCKIQRSVKFKSSTCCCFFSSYFSCAFLFFFPFFSFCCSFVSVCWDFVLLVIFFWFFSFAVSLLLSFTSTVHCINKPWNEGRKIKKNYTNERDRRTLFVVIFVFYFALFASIIFLFCFFFFNEPTRIEMNENYGTNTLLKNNSFNLNIYFHLFLFHLLFTNFLLCYQRWTQQREEKWFFWIVSVCRS